MAAMKHLIEFRVDGTVTLESHGVTTSVQIRAGVQCPATVRCYVVSPDGEDYTDVGDVEVMEGLLRALPCFAFMFIDRLG
jgi:hypothetical protein